MAYTDLINSQVTMVPAGTQYNFAFDSPIAADGSPHITNFGIQTDLASVAAQVPATGLSQIITQMRIKVGDTIIMNWNDNAVSVSPSLSQLGVLIQRLGGSDFCSVVTDAAAGSTQTISELTWPVGLDASRSHRVNVSVTLGNEANMMGQPLLPAGSDLNISLSFGTSTESVLVGSQQTFQMAVGTRAVTIHGKPNFSMLAVFAASNQQVADDIDTARVNNGAFRELTVNQWRSLNNSYKGNRDATALTLGNVPDIAGVGILGVPTPLSGQAGCLFMNLRRITAGSGIDIAFTMNAAAVVFNVYPIWVAPISAKSGRPPRQTLPAVSTPSKTVESGTQS